MAVVYITANVSGGHLNPAVTFATCLTGHTSWAKGGLYVLAQVLGGIFGSLMGVSQLLHHLSFLHNVQCLEEVAQAAPVAGPSQHVGGVAIVTNPASGNERKLSKFYTCLQDPCRHFVTALVTAAAMPTICDVTMQAVLIPSVTVGGGDEMPGCFTHEGGVTITKGQLFLWELIMTFVLVSTVYAVAVTKPGHGNIGPLAVGFSLFASAFIGKQSYPSDTAAKPARQD